MVLLTKIVPLKMLPIVSMVKRTLFASPKLKVRYSDALL